MKFPISSLVMIGIAGILLFMFIMFNYAFHDPDVGIKAKLNESAQDTMTGDRLTNWEEQISELSMGFGIASALCFILAIVFFVFDVLGDRREY